MRRPCLSTARRHSSRTVAVATPWPATSCAANNLAAWDVFDSEDEAFALARAANPRPTDATLRHRLVHNLRPQSDGTLTFRYDKELRTNPRALFDHTPDTVGGLAGGNLPGAAGARCRK